MASKMAVNEADNLVDQSFTLKARSLDGTNGPIERNVYTFLGFGIGSFYDFGRKQVQCAVDILLAILVPYTPSAAWRQSAFRSQRVQRSVTLRHARNLGQRIEVWDIRHAVDLLLLR